MRINNFFKYLMIIFLSFICVLLVGTGSADAVLQSNGNTAATYNIGDWIANVRKMESLGGAMGLSEFIGNDLMPTTDSNNIDVHMQKNTEYGAMAILSASAYGNPGVIASGDTTTGNVTGIVMPVTYEWTAAGMLTSVTSYVNASNRYKNIYTETYEQKRGDAITETEGWHVNGKNLWIDSTWKAGLVRSSSGSIFSYNGRGDDWGFEDYAGLSSKKHASRAVVVVGEDL